MRAGRRSDTQTDGNPCESFHVKRNVRSSKAAEPLRLRGLAPKVHLALDRYVCLLEKWHPITNLVSKQDIKNVWMRHVVDSLPLCSLVPNARRWLDIGSGAGFPGVVIAIQLADVSGALIHVVESDNRKCVFLREVARQLQLPIRVHNRRAESIAPSEIDPINAISARAFASVRQIMDIALPFLNAGAVTVLPRGRSVVSELDDLDASCYSIHDYPNPPDSGGYILLIEKRTISELV
jgi:16S rRNA (guanine527-N7)-methyltransferase